VVAVAVVAVTFVEMEGATYLIHRYVMHGRGMVWHASHHAPAKGRLERNDWYPVVFASTTMAVMAIGAAVPALRILLPIGVGITAYGMAYVLVHDVFIHGRVVRLRRPAAIERLHDAHALHHRYGGEPYGMLLPVVPASLRARAEADASRGRRTRTLERLR
jgi:beta-carotene 3-hydroxylase